MIAYNRKDLDNRLILRDVDAAWQKKCITEEERQAVRTAYPVKLYTPNPFIRIGLFIGTIVAALGAFGLFLAGTHDQDVLTMLIFFFSIVYYAMLEMFVQHKHHFGSGVDDALIWLSGIYFITGFLAATELDIDEIWIYLLVLLTGTYFTLRFGNMLTGAAAFIGLTGMVLYAAVRLGSTAQAFVPFFIMGISLMVYLASARLLQQQRFRHYFPCLELLSFLALIMLYAGGNYFVVRELGSVMFGMEMRLEWLFWLFTTTIPVICLYLGIRRKDATLLRTGLLLIAVAAFTVRHYHQILSSELAMVFGGTAMIAVAWYITRYLREPKQGFTKESNDEPEAIGKLQIESLVIAETLQDAPQPPKGFRFGGGTGGGAGAGGDF